MFVLLAVFGFVTLWLLFPRLAFVVALTALIHYLGWAHPSSDATLTTDRAIFSFAVIFGAVGLVLDAFEHICSLRRWKKTI